MVLRTLRDIAKIIITDCGTDTSAAVMRGVLAEANQIVVASSTVEDEAAVVSATLDDLWISGHQHLVRNAIIVIARKPTADRHEDRIVAHFRERTKAVVMVPYDREVRTGGVFDPEAIDAATRLAYMTMAAQVIDGLARPGATA
jgi:MinD-like ATPase involved in chromosome partitioning or flagellar assembly